MKTSTLNRRPVEAPMSTIEQRRADKAIARTHAMFGPLTRELRNSLHELVTDPTPEAWLKNRSLIIHGDTHITLWQAVSKHSDFGDGYRATPTRSEILLGLELGTV